MHDGCGAAIRVAPVGIFQQTSDLDAVVSGAREASISTHGGTLAIAAAAATAAAISARSTARRRKILSLAERAAALAERRWPGTGAPAVAKRFTTRTRISPRCPSCDPAISPRVGFLNGPLTIVPLALALATVMRSAEKAILVATNIGGDSDSVASIAGGILGARHPETINDK